MFCELLSYGLSLNGKMILQFKYILMQKIKPSVIRTH